jgi:putative hydrolase of the HAD superfamily
MGGALYHAAMQAPPLDWSAIDTVLLDMDGTLLDLRFDNWFWQEYVPELWGRLHGMTAEAALSVLTPRFEAARGTLDWYCLDHWSREFQMDLRAIKHEVRERVQYIPGAEDFLLRLKRLGKRRVLVTNAHPETLAIKDAHVDLVGHLDEVHSSHPFGLPKEHAGFWPRLRERTEFDPARTLFVDDSAAVLHSAIRAGLRWVYGVRRPDSSAQPHRHEEFESVDGVADLL